MQLSLRRSVSRFKSHSYLALVPVALLQWSSAHATDVNADCAAAYGSNFTPVVGQVAAPAPTSPRPVKGVVAMDPNFHTCVIRATNAATEPPIDFARNDYSRRQAFNADNSRFIVYSSGGAWHMYDANTLAYIRQLNGLAGDAEPQWDATDPKSLYYVPTNGGMSLLKLNVETNTSTVAADFTGKLPWSSTARVWTKSEGSPSANGRYWCFMAETSSFGILGVFTYDLQTQTVIGARALTDMPDHVSMSASGRYCVVSHGYQTTGTVAWNPTFTTSRQLHTNSEHSDLALGADGHDVFVFVDYQSNAGDLVMVDVDTGVRSTLLSTYIDGTATSYHVSGKGFNKPGWILLGTYGHSGAEKWLHERVMAVELKASPKIINLAHHHSIENGYWTEPHASISRDFTKVLFSSNWGTTSATDVDAFMIRLPDNLLGGSTTPPPPVADTTKPTVTAAASGTSGTITLSANASDNVGVTSVDFMVDGVLKGSDSSSPYALSLASSGLSDGTHSLVAVAYDAAANAATSAAVSFTVQNAAPAPTPDTTAPTVSASVSGGNRNITLKGTATDNVGVTRVEFWVDGVLKGSDASNPYAMTVQSSSISAGSHSLVAKAYDAAGNVKSSAPVTFKRNLR